MQNIVFVHRVDQKLCDSFTIDLCSVPELVHLHKRATLNFLLQKEVCDLAHKAVNFLQVEVKIRVSRVSLIIGEKCKPIFKFGRAEPN